MGKTPAYGTKSDLIAYILSPEGLAAKLSDAGPTHTEAREWVDAVIDGEVARRAPSFATVEAVALAVLRDHYKGPGWVWGGGWHRDRPGRWSCSCGAAGELGQGDRITDFHRRHVAQVLAHGITGKGNDHE